MINLQSINGFSSDALSSVLKNELATNSVNGGSANKGGQKPQSMFEQMLNEANTAIEQQAGSLGAGRMANF